MRRPRYLDFECLRCGHAEERFVETNEDGSSCELQLCTAPIVGERAELWHGSTCEEPMTLVTFGTGHAPLIAPINRSNSDFAERQRTRLEKRSYEHWRKKGKDEAIDRQRALMKK